MTLNIFLHLTDKFGEFRKNGILFDCVLISSHSQPIKSHRLILAKYSSWFKDYFKQHPKTNNQPVEVDLPVNPNNKFEEFLDFFYNQYKSVAYQDIPSFLKIATFYQFSIIQANLINIFPKAIDNDTILPFVKDLIDFDLDEQVSTLIPMISRHFIASYTNDPQKCFELEAIYRSISPIIIAKLLNLDEVKCVMTSDMKRVDCIEEFLKYYTKPLKDEEKKQLESTVEVKNNFQLFIKYKCDWISDETALPNLKRLLEKRQKTLTSYQKKIALVEKNESKSVSHWYQLAWVQRIALCKPDTDFIHLLHFISTIGYLANPINPIQYRFVTPKSCSPPLLRNCKVENAFSRNSSYYIASINKDKATGQQIYPTIGFDVGPLVHFSVKGVLFDSNGDWQHAEIIGQNRYTYAQKGKTKNVNFYTGTNQGIPCSLGPNSEDSKLDGYTFRDPIKNCHDFVFEMNGENDMGGSIMRVCVMDVFGNFTTK